MNIHITHWNEISFPYIAFGFCQSEKGKMYRICWETNGNWALNYSWVQFRTYIVMLAKCLFTFNFLFSIVMPSRKLIVLNYNYRCVYWLFFVVVVAFFVKNPHSIDWAFFHLNGYGAKLICSDECWRCWRYQLKQWT